MKILYIAPLNNACTFYRCKMPGWYLVKQGLAEVVVTTQFSKEHVDWADIVVMQRVYGDTAYHVAKYCKLFGRKLIYELDDNIFNYPDSPEYKKDFAQQETVGVIKIMRQCDGVTTTTEAIADAVKELVDVKVYVLPNQIDFSNFPELNVEKKNAFIVGWAGGHFHIQDLSLIEEPLSRILEKYPHVMIAMLGCCPKGLYEKYKGRVWVEPFSSIEDFFSKMALMRFDVGLAPLYKTEFARGRSNLRLLQYAALKIPIVASNYGEYGAMLTDKDVCPTNNGFRGIKAEDGEWFEKICYLIENEGERKRFGEEAYNYVKEHYDIEKNVCKWAGCYEEIINHVEGFKGSKV